MKLYRGDRFSNSTEPGRYYFDGIRSKSFGKGHPRNIIAEDLLTSIRQHINPVSLQDKMIYAATEFISFSTSKGRALYWLSDEQKITLALSTLPYNETRYLFEVDIDESQMLPMDKHATIFRFTFACNYDLKMPNSSSPVEQAMVTGTSSGSYFRSCPICLNKTVRGHALVLIDAVKYLQAYKDSSAYDGAVANAQLDEEWLILPVDKLADFSGTAIPRADFWKAEHFTGLNETRDPLGHEMPGMSYDENGNVV